MTAPKKFRKGKHEEIDWGHGTKEIRKMKKKEQPQAASLDIAIDDATARGEYSTLVAISHGESEFYLDFMSVQPGQPRAKVSSRVISHPVHTKRFAAALSNAIRQYEEQFGEIQDPQLRQPPPGSA